MSSSCALKLSPDAIPFFSCVLPSSLCKREVFLHTAEEQLSHHELSLFKEIVSEWESHPMFDSIMKFWNSKAVPQLSNETSNLKIISFNVRGFDARWQEVLLLSDSYAPDIIVLLETGVIESNFVEKCFPEFQVYYQSGENKNGGTCILVNNKLSSTIVLSNLPNVCAVDIEDTKQIRIIGVYAPESKTWTWDDLSSFVTKETIFIGDFNVDFNRDNTKADALLAWTDRVSAAPLCPKEATSLRSNRTIDFAIIKGSILSNTTIQVIPGNTTSDHKPLLTTTPRATRYSCLGQIKHWKVFNLFLEFTAEWWKSQWDLDHLDITYQQYVQFLRVLSERCTSKFDLSKYRSALPSYLRTACSYVRAISFRQKRSGCYALKQYVNICKRWLREEIMKFRENVIRTRMHEMSNHRVARKFWSRAKYHMKPSKHSIRAFLDDSERVVSTPTEMCKLAANFYEEFLRLPVVVRPHPYTDTPHLTAEPLVTSIASVTLDELLAVVCNKKSSASQDAHGISNALLKQIPRSHWCSLVKLYENSFRNNVLPVAWKDTRMILLAKKNSVCHVNDTRPISMLDVFQKVGESLFLSRFREILKDLNILPDNQSGFRDKFRLQTRMLLLLEDISSHLANSSPVCTVFVDFRSAFDQLWFEGCIGKLKKLRIPHDFVAWIENWLTSRRAYIEIQGHKSRWFRIEKGGPQGGVLTPTLFITYHSDMSSYLSWCTSHFFADDLAAVLAGQMGVKYTQQCIDLEKRVQSFLKQLEEYCLLTVQPVNWAKTLAQYSCNTIGNPPFEIFLPNSTQKVEWCKRFKYLGYWITPKLGWGNLIRSTALKIRQRTALCRSFRLHGTSNPKLRLSLFSSFVLPLFSWVYPIFPLLTAAQQRQLEQLYGTTIKRLSRCSHWDTKFLLYVLDLPTLSDRVRKYWSNYFLAISDSIDGSLILEQTNLNILRDSWYHRDFSIRCVNPSRRYKHHIPVLEKITTWLASEPIDSSRVDFPLEDVICLLNFPETFGPW